MTITSDIPLKTGKFMHSFYMTQDTIKPSQKNLKGSNQDCGGFEIRMEGFYSGFEKAQQKWMARWRNESEVILKDKVSSSRDAFEIFKSLMGDLAYKEFWILILNKANRVLKKARFSEGGVSGSVVDPKKVFKIALDLHASSIILGHNHPSGNIQPSEADNKITHKIKDCGIMLDVAVLDHFIIGDDRYYLFADEGSI